MAFCLRPTTQRLPRYPTANPSRVFLAPPRRRLLKDRIVRRSPPRIARRRGALYRIPRRGVELPPRPPRGAFCSGHITSAGLHSENSQISQCVVLFFLFFFYISSSCFDLRVSVLRDLRFPLVRLSGCRGSSSALRRLALQLQQTDLGRHSLVLVLLQRVQAAVQPLLRRRSRLPVFRLAAVIHLV